MRDVRCEEDDLFADVTFSEQDEWDDLEAMTYVQAIAAVTLDAMQRDGYLDPLCDQLMGETAETLATRLEHGWSPLFAIRTPSHHYVRAPRPELYELASDPGQLHNQLEIQPEAKMAGTLDAEIARILAGEVDVAEQVVDDDSRDQLRSLGYLIPERELPETGIDPKDGLLALRDLDIEAGDAAYGLRFIRKGFGHCDDDDRLFSADGRDPRVGARLARQREPAGGLHR